MAKDYGDPRHPVESDYLSLRQAVINCTPGDISSREVDRLCGKAAARFKRREVWDAPDGTRIEALFHAREIRNGSPDPQIVGYRKLRDNEWFVALDGEVLHGPVKTYRHAKHTISVKKAKSVEAGWYRAKGHDIFRRDMAEKVLGRKLSKEER